MRPCVLATFALPISGFSPSGSTNVEVPRPQDDSHDVGLRSDGGSRDVPSRTPIPGTPSRESRVGFLLLDSAPNGKHTLRVVTDGTGASANALVPASMHT